ncbi:MAG: hypothetical protein N2115_08225 [bacterium]|nr:hypothetical protein [bacterium]
MPAYVFAHLSIATGILLAGMIFAIPVLVVFPGIRRKISNSIRK